MRHKDGLCHRRCNTYYLLRSTERIRKQKFEPRLDISSETNYCSHLLSPLSNLKSTRTVFIRIEAPSRIKAPPCFWKQINFFFQTWHLLTVTFCQMLSVFCVKVFEWQKMSWIMSQWVRHIKHSKFSLCAELLPLLSAVLIIYWFFSKFGLGTGCLNSNKYGISTTRVPTWAS